MAGAAASPDSAWTIFHLPCSNLCICVCDIILAHANKNWSSSLGSDSCYDIDFYCCSDTLIPHSLHVPDQVSPPPTELDGVVKVCHGAEGHVTYWEVWVTSSFPCSSAEFFRKYMFTCMFMEKLYGFSVRASLTFIAGCLWRDFGVQIDSSTDIPSQDILPFPWHWEII